VNFSRNTHKGHELRFPRKIDLQKRFDIIPRCGANSARQRERSFINVACILCCQYIKTLDELNRYWSYYVEEYYQKQPHDGIREYYESCGITVPEEGISPETEWNRDSRPLSFIDASTVGEAFLHYETREVDKGGCISFKGGLYEVSTSLIGAVVTVAYDPMRYDTITVTYPGIVPIMATRTEIGAFCDKKPEIPLSMLPVEPETSRMLDVLEKKHRENRARRTDAISYSALQKGGEL
jgi:Mu transposase, C-terminal.